jgi:dienelactone hydrolase
MVARTLEEAGLGTLLFDLLTAEEEREPDAPLRFDIGLLADRLLAALAWARQAPGTRSLAHGCFGASTGAAAALVAAARQPAWVAAVVSRGGRPDLAGEALRAVGCPTLLLVGGHDPDVLALNRSAYDALQGERALRVVEGATHLFPEPGALEIVARQAAAWFLRHLPAVVTPGRAEPPGRT